MNYEMFKEYQETYNRLAESLDENQVELLKKITELSSQLGNNGLKL